MAAATLHPFLRRPDSPVPLDSDGELPRINKMVRFVPPEDLKEACPRLSEVKHVTVGFVSELAMLPHKDMTKFASEMRKTWPSTKAAGVGYMTLDTGGQHGEDYFIKACFMVDANTLYEIIKDGDLLVAGLRPRVVEHARTWNTSQGPARRAGLRKQVSTKTKFRRAKWCYGNSPTKEADAVFEISTYHINSEKLNVVHDVVIGPNDIRINFFTCYKPDSSDKNTKKSITRNQISIHFPMLEYMMKQAEMRDLVAALGEWLSSLPPPGATTCKTVWMGPEDFEKARAEKRKRQQREDDEGDEVEEEGGERPELTTSSEYPLGKVMRK